MKEIKKYMLKRGNSNIDVYGRYLKSFSNETPEKYMKNDLWQVHNIYELESSKNKGNEDMKYLDNEERHEIQNGVESINYTMLAWESKEDMLDEFRTMYLDGEDNKIYQELKKYFEVK